jgi:hypothetical protein
MKRWALAVAVCCVALFAAVVVHQATSRDDTPTDNGPESARTLELRFHQGQVRHWRGLLLQR